MQTPVVTTRSAPVHGCYSDTRPNYLPPTSLEDLLSREPTFRHRYLPLLPEDRQAAILEIGCGCGELLYFMQREGYRNACGVDFDCRQVQLGQRLGIKNIIAARAEDILADRQEVFDSIVAIDVLEHVPKAKIIEFLALVRESLRLGGRFVCQVPNLTAFYLPHFYMDFTHEAPFTAASLKQVLSMAGFGDVRVRPANPVPHGFKSSLRAILWKGLSWSFRFIAAVEAGPQPELNSIFTSAIVAVAKKV